MPKKVATKFCLLIIFLISVFLVVGWFRKGVLLGSAESALPFYNPEQEFRDALFAWTGKILGLSAPTNTTNRIFYAFAACLVKLGFSRFVVQAFVFFTFFFTAAISTYFLSSLVFSKKPQRELCSLLAALFYSLNPFSLVVVWGRIQYPYMSFYALMPLALLLFIKGLKSRNLTYAVCFNFVCLGFVLAFASFSLLELFWLVIGSYFLFYILTNWQDRKSVIFAFRFLFFTFFLWLLLNLWWLIQFVNLLFATKFVTTQVVTRLGDILTLRAISERLGRLLYLFRFHHKSFFGNMIAIWGPIYFSPLFLIFGFLSPIFAFGSLLVKKKPKLYWYFALLAVLGLFSVKGSAPPLGQIFLFVFSHFRPLEAFRNPFEKIGLILPLGFAPLFSLGLTSFCSWLKKFSYQFAALSLFTSCFLIFGIYSFPMWNGWVFSSIHPPTNDLDVGYRVQVPNFYKQADAWLNQDQSGFRGIAFPIGEEGITYDWEYGYAGVELSNVLFNKPFVSLNTPFQYLGEIVFPLEDFFLKNTERFYKLMGVLNSKYLMVRSDIDYELRGMRSPEVIRKRLEEMNLELARGTTQDNNLGFTERFGELEFWKVKDDFFVPHFYVAGSASLVDKNLQNPYTPLSFDDFELREAVFSSGEESGLPLELADNIYISGQPHPRKEIQITELGAGQFLPGSKFYPFVRWKEKRAEREVLATNDPDKMIDFHLGLASKRLGEVEKLMEKASKLKQSTGESETGQRGDERKMKEYEELIEENWKRFWERLDKAYELLKEMENQKEDAAETAVRVLTYTKFFQGEFGSFLNGEGPEADISDRLKKLLVLRYQLEQKAWITHDELEKRYFIEVPKTGSYEFFVKEFADPQLIRLGERMDNVDRYRRLFEEDPFQPMTFALSGNLATVSAQKRKDGWLSFGDYQLEEGRQKLQIFLPRFVNLAKQENLTLSAEKEQSLVLPLDDFLEQGRSFNISFVYRIKGENKPRIVVAQKLEIEGKDEVRRVIDTGLPKSEHELQFIKSFAIHPAASRVGVTIFFEEYGDSEIEIGNFQVTRDWQPTVVFRATTNSSEFKEADGLGEKLIDQKRPKITFQRVNPTRYEVKVEEAEVPYLLVFSESFHPGWRLYLDRTDGEGDVDDKILASYFDEEIRERLPRNDFAYQGMFDTWGRKEAIPQERHLLANGYANSWLIKPEDVEEKGSYKLIVEFWPQRLFYLGLFISGVTFLGCLGYLGYHRLGKRREGNGK